jgi:hypothetical protein
VCPNDSGPDGPEVATANVGGGSSVIATGVAQMLGFTVMHAVIVTVVSVEIELGAV